MCTGSRRPCATAPRTRGPTCACAASRSSRRRRRSRQNPDWAAHREATRDIEVATLDDLDWADAYVFGSPTRFGNVAAQLKQFIDSAGPLWAEGRLAGKIASGFTSSQNAHGGQESTLLALYATMYHWGAIVVAPGYTDPRVFASGGNPYGASSTDAPGDEELDGARHLGERVTAIAARLGAPVGQ